ncbi:hypothetical protein T08_13521 [Trichinella sp. T8]|nr:hypothetical protein T08_13521 [Trichinella sp. T8]
MSWTNCASTVNGNRMKQNRRHRLQNKHLKYGTEKNYFNTFIAKSPIRKLQSKRPIREKEMLYLWLISFE